MSSEPSTHLERGKACTPCRRRKMKCDGNKPHCNQCIRSNRVAECEFSEVSVPSTARLLEQHIAKLQTRIQELEQDDPEAVRLHDPRVFFNQPQAAPSQQGQDWWAMPEPPVQLAGEFVGRFFSFSFAIGFFMDKSRFLTTFFNPTVSKPRPPFVLRNAIYLWGIYASPDEQCKARYPLFLDRTLRSIHIALSALQPRDILSVLQAEILLAYFFFHNGRLAEGKFYSDAAVSLSIICSLHKIRAPQGYNLAATHQDMVDDTSTFIAPVKSAAEEGERIHAWWTVFVLDKCWVIALGSPSIIVEVRENAATWIETQWPMTLEEYEQPQGFGVNPGRTIQSFLDGLLAGNNGQDSSRLATIAKAAALYEHANRHATLWKTDITARQGDFMRLDSCVERFKQTLPTLVHSQNPSHEVLHSLLLVYTLSQCATIQLHVRFVRQNSTSRSRCLAAANAVVRFAQTLPIQQLKFVNPIMAVLYSSTADVILDGLRSLRSMRSAWASSAALPGDDVLEATLGQLIAVTEHFATNSPIMSTQLEKIRQSQTDA
ncbi:hypothetical protein BXZ70DRAFT_385284 [Cristinia sonorae]|uniref:Zn(2)-C6 fungal-type domain-containing protein n=1 Tax=Cristinia sonorae TaxID=1940300 RepID=A0A8K0UK54_9AGAR|nr:hypothetical protein BXZ70DRAFT_385284 [Cristinia sonorae]